MKGDFNMKSAKSKRQLTLVTLAAALGVAVYLNWEYAKSDSPYAMVPTGSSDVVQVSNTTKDVPVMEALPDKNYGDAQLVNAQGNGSSEYFEQARLSRTKTRDEALDKMQKTLQNTQLTETEKQTLVDQLSHVIEGITIESDVENMVKAKGFADCVAFLDGDKMNLAVKTASEGLTKAEVAQLRDIVVSKTSVLAQNISIVEVK